MTGPESSDSSNASEGADRTGLAREAAVDRLETIVETVEAEPMAVPIREIWAFGDLALGLDPVERFEVYVTKDLLMTDEPDREEAFREEYGVAGVGKSVSAEWAERYPEHLRASAHGHAAPEKCLAAHLLDGVDDVSTHLEVCNASFEDNVSQRLRGAQLRGDYTQLLDPRGVCLWVDGTRSPTAFEKLRESAFAMPTLSAALEMLGMGDEEAAEAASELHAWREDRDGVTVRGDVV